MGHFMRQVTNKTPPSLPELKSHAMFPVTLSLSRRGKCQRGAALPDAAPLRCALITSPSPHHAYHTYARQGDHD